MPTQQELNAFIAALGPYAPRVALQYFDTLPSTNTRASQAAADGAPEGTLLIAASQTAGRGRLGRSFYSPGDTGLYMSMVLRPRLPAQKAVQLTAAAAVAVTDAVDEVFCLSAGIKWVNDIFLNDRKVCGILTESTLAPDGTLARAVVGIGVNLAPPAGGFPPELADIVGALCPAECLAVQRFALAGAVWRRFFTYYDALPRPLFLPEYRSRSVAIGRQAVLVKPGQPAGQGQPVTVTGIDEDCALLVRTADGETRRVESGEISLRVTEM